MSDLIIIGAGAAGLMSAVIAARNGHSVTVIDGSGRAGKKIYATGNGRCNFTNLYFDEDSFRGSDVNFAYDAYDKFNNTDLIQFFEEIGIWHKDINGYVYPNSEQASAIVEVLLSELKRLNVKIVLEEKIIDVTKRGEQFICMGQKRTYNSSKLIIAAGGLASPNHGSDGSIFPACKRLGHRFVQQVPALVNLKYKEKAVLSKLAGVRFKADVCLYINNLPVHEENGEIIINRDNISGIPIMQLSRYCSYALKDNKKVALHIDFFYDSSEDDIRDFLSARLYGTFSKGKSVYECVTGMVNNKLLDLLLRKAGINPEKKAQSVKPNEINSFIEQLKDFVVNISETGGFDAAQVTAGGIRTDEIKPTMESKLVKGLYFAGEILDVDGTCGGYNLQWAFTSGYIAGQLE